MPKTSRAELQQRLIRAQAYADDERFLQRAQGLDPHIRESLDPEFWDRRVVQLARQLLTLDDREDDT